MTRKQALGILVGLTPILVSVAVVGRRPSSTPARIPLETLFRQESKTTFTVSPDGRTIAYIGHDGARQHLFVQDIATGTTTPVTPDSDSTFPPFSFMNRRPYYWIDADTILFSKEDSQGQKIYSAKVRTRQVKCLTDSAGSRSSIVSIEAGRPGEVMISTNKRAAAAPDLYRLNLATGEMTLAYENKGGPKAYFTDANGRLRITREPAGIFKVDEKTGTSTMVADHSHIELFVPIRISDDNRKLYAYSAVKRDRLALVEYDLDGGTETVLWDDLAYDVYSREERNDAITPTADFYYSAALKKPLYAYYYRDDFRLRFFDDALKARVEAAGKRIGKYDLRVDSFSDDLDRLIVTASSAKVKGNIYIYDHKTGRATLLHRLSGWLSEGDMADVKPIEYQSRDGRTIHGYLTLPPGRSVSKLPLVVYTHGGPMLRDTHGFNDISQFFANRGFLVLECDYRGSSGYGIEFQMAGYKQLGRKMQDDITDGVEWLVARGMADRSRIAIYGFSSGGLNVLAGLAFTPDLYAAGISVSGLIHQVNTIKAMGSPTVYERFGHPTQDAEMLTKASPYFFADAIKASVILAYGARDRSIPIQDVDDFAAKLKSQGKDVEYLRYDALGHNLLYDPAVKLELFRSIERLLERRLR
jgi:dipeptidyl aminopeptidase/acylaminoacyl peptidase